ncbi:MAG: hypothetical protein CMG23_08660 [Candidatus Marinimicrobia bacterium]|nr:hypothetical protein [Candidatus Neomarinimicrobiota bacterium]
MLKSRNIIRGIVIFSILWCEERKDENVYFQDNFKYNTTAKIGDNPFPTNPISDRAIGYLLQGKAQSAISNYGNIINWDEHPMGIWNGYSYLPSVAFLAGVPGQKYSFNFFWENIEYIVDENGNTLYGIWESSEAYEDWFLNGEENYVGIIFNSNNDFGEWNPDSISKKNNIDQINQEYQWIIDNNSKKIILSSKGDLDPNKSTARIGFIYPWALRPKLISREDQFDFYNYGSDLEEWTQDDEYMYYGFNVSESWLSRIPGSINGEWHASTMSRVHTHNTDIKNGEIFGDTYVTDPSDTYPLLAHSGFSDTWPVRFNESLGINESFWPGWWAQDYNINLPGCSESRKDPDCWEEVPGRFISDMDVYMEFDDRWAHRGNMVNTNNEYEQTGYPMGLRVMAEAHSYGVSYAEDILFVTVKVRNESGDWCAEDEYGQPVLDEYGNQKCGSGMIMPDGTKLNKGKGFNYQGTSLGFYFDADVLVGAQDGYNASIHTNDDDFMKYYWDIFELNNERMLISMAMVGDYDGSSGANGYAMSGGAPQGSDFGIVATQLLDSPRATDPVDLDQDGVVDIFPGEPLKMTDWHWFDWYSRPGVPQMESNSSSCYTGAEGCPQARNKEEIMYKIMVGDTVNLSENEKQWHFHTPNPGTDLGTELNPHFDSLEGLLEEPAFLRDSEGLDCSIFLSCGPFDLPVGREVPFSFCIIFGQNENDLINNARFAQVMYNSKYQGFTPPARPNVFTESDTGLVKIYWDDIAEISTDVLTGYSDFEGYKIYKSIDGGTTWGGASDRIYDTNGLFVGWTPYKQFDLSAVEDSLHCVYSNDYNCEKVLRRNHSIKGPDPYFPWFNLGDDTGLEMIRLDESDWKIKDGITYKYMFMDQNVIDGMEYTYSIVAYDMGVEPTYKTRYISKADGEFEAIIDTNYSNPNEWANPDGYASIENSKGTTVLDRNFVQTYPGILPQENLNNVKVVPNPYLGRSSFKESEFIRQIRFTNLPEKCKIKIFTLSGELVSEILHEDQSSGNEWWDMRTLNNQEASPGLYLYHIQKFNSIDNIESEEIVGKFAIVR